MSHTCPARGCKVVVPDELLMCRADWYRVPRPLRTAVLRAYAGGRGLGTGALLHAQEAAIRAVNREAGAR
jgi:hypothetical protein